MEELSEYEELALKTFGYIFDNNESVGKLQDELGWSNVRKQNNQFVVRGSVRVNGEKESFMKVYNSIQDVIDRKESTLKDNG